MAPNYSLWLRPAMLLFLPAGMRANSFSSLLPTRLLWALEPHSTEGLNFLSLFPKSMFPQYVWKPSYRNSLSHSLPTLCNALATLNVFFGCIDMAVAVKSKGESSPRGGAQVLSCDLVGSMEKESTVGSECHSSPAASSHLEIPQISRKVSRL